MFLDKVDLKDEPNSQSFLSSRFSITKVVALPMNHFLFFVLKMPVQMIVQVDSCVFNRNFQCGVSTISWTMISVSLCLVSSIWD